MPVAVHTKEVKDKGLPMSLFPVLRGGISTKVTWISVRSPGSHLWKLPAGSWHTGCGHAACCGGCDVSVGRCSCHSLYLASRARGCLHGQQCVPKGGLHRCHCFPEHSPHALCSCGFFSGMLAAAIAPGRPQGGRPFRVNMGLIALASEVQRGRNGLRRLLVSTS